MLYIYFFSSHSELDDDAGHDDHLHQQDGRVAAHLGDQDDRHLVDHVPAGPLLRGRPPHRHRVHQRGGAGGQRGEDEDNQPPRDNESDQTGRNLEGCKWYNQREARHSLEPK